MNSPQETQLHHDLRDLVSGQPFTPDLETIGRRARQRHRRALALRGATTGTVAVLAVGGVFAGVHAAGGGTPAKTPSAAPRGAPAVQRASTVAPARTETVAYVTARVKSALGNVNNYILRSDQVQTGPDGDSATNWTDPRTGNDYEILYDATAGKSVAWLSTYLVHRVLTWKDIEADYSTRTWFVLVFHAAGPIQGSTAGATSSVMTPADIKEWLDAGKLKIIGHQYIDGHHTIGLRQPWATGYRELWVDSRTFLPVRLITADFANLKVPMRNVRLVADDTWLPRTQQLLTMVNHVHIPAGFTQVAPPQ
jgi:hypothetical protein